MKPLIFILTAIIAGTILAFVKAYATGTTGHDAFEWGFWSGGASMWAFFLLELLEGRK